MGLTLAKFNTILGNQSNSIQFSLSSTEWVPVCNLIVMAMVPDPWIGALMPPMPFMCSPERVLYSVNELRSCTIWYSAPISPIQLFLDFEFELLNMLASSPFPFWVTVFAFFLFSSARHFRHSWAQCPFLWQ